MAEQIKALKAKGVPGGRITVVGASQGGAIAVMVSHLVQDKDVNYVLLAACGTTALRYFEEQKVCVMGNVLSIYDAGDELADTCDSLFTRCRDRLGEHRELVLGLRMRHGLVYRPVKGWVEPTLSWAKR